MSCGGKAPLETARDTVKVYVGRLRKLLPANGSAARLVTRGGGYLLEIEPEQLDLHRFQRLAERGSRTLAGDDAEAAAALLREALALWRGPPLADLADAAAIRAEQGRLEELRLNALEERIDADLALGRASALVPELQQLTREQPYRERLHRQLMLALYRSGRQADALEAYRALRQHLASELGLEPSRDSQDLERAILAADPGLAPVRSKRSVRVADAEAATRATPVPPRRRLGPKRVAVLGVVVALVAIVVVVVRATSKHASPGNMPAGRVVGRIAVPLPGGPFVGRMAFNAGSLWIRKSGDDEVLRVDPRTNRVIARIRLGFAYDTGIAARGGDVWVTNGEDGTVSDRRRHERRRRDRSRR